MTRSLHYFKLDVFTNSRFSGNPLAVIEAADALSRDEMQAIAREFNLSETVFLMAPRDPVHTARARIFTPSTELPFAGHPTLGAVALIAETRAADVIARNEIVIIIEEAIGAIRCEARRTRSGAIYAQFDAPSTPRKLGAAPPRDAIAAALSLHPSDIGFDAHVSTLHSAGVGFLFVPIRSRAALDRARRGEGFAATAGAAIGAYLYSREAVDPESAIHARMFAHGLGFDEDPATGAAAAAFAGVAFEFERPDDGEHEIQIEQGYAMGRPSRITLRMTVAEGRLAHVAIGGQVVRVGEGTLRL